MFRHLHTQYIQCLLPFRTVPLYPSESPNEQRRRQTEALHRHRMG